MGRTTFRRGLWALENCAGLSVEQQLRETMVGFCPVSLSVMKIMVPARDFLAGPILAYCWNFL